MTIQMVTIVYDAQSREIRAIINPSPRNLKLQPNERSINIPLSIYKQHSTQKDLALRIVQTAPAFDPK